MPTYDYECSECAHQDEIFQKFSETPLSICTSCGASSFNRVILQPPLAFIKGEARTVGQWADRNSKKMGRYEREDREEADNMKTRNEATEASALRRKINKMTPAQQKKYIEGGDNA
jgi:putative FmdB family regulatory protein